ncbi:serine hydrolase [soil metagenome]
MSATFLRAIEEAKDGLPGSFAACAERLDGDERLAWNETAVFPAASVIKIAIALEVLHSLDLATRLRVGDDDKVIGSGVLSGMDAGTFSVRDLLYLSMAISDNTAANVLIGRVGVERINARLAGLGLVATRLSGKLIAGGGEFSPTTAAELVTLLRHVATDAPLMALMERTQTASTVGRGLPDSRFPGVDPSAPPLTLAYKTGSIVGVVAEAALVRTPTCTYAVALLSQDSGDLRPNHTNLARVHLGEVSRAIWETFARGRSGDPGRLPSRGSHGSGRADFLHPALRSTDSLRRPTR